MSRLLHLQRHFERPAHFVGEALEERVVGRHAGVDLEALFPRQLPQVDFQHSCEK